jgi:hypothetical protein
MTTSHSSPSLSLYQIEAELVQLVRYREEVASDTEITPQEQQASLDAIDKQITAYVHREVAKVDGIAAYLRECETRAKVLRAEAQRLREQSDAWEDRGNRVEAVTLRVMQQTGATLLEGTNSTFKVKKNPPSVDVAQPELVPAPYLRVAVTMSEDLFARITSHLFGTDKGATLFAELIECKRSNPEPMKDAIKAELKQGVGVPGCRLKEDSVRLVVE